MCLRNEIYAHGTLSGLQNSTRIISQLIPPIYPANQGRAPLSAGRANIDVRVEATE